MKLYGHAYVATQVLPESNQELITLGSLLPEVVFYTTNPALTFEQIHEGGLEIYKFCESDYSDFADLAIGIMTHSVRYGADSYNSIEALRAVGYEEEDIPMISHALGVTLEIAKIGAHNMYDLSLDWFILRNHPEIGSLVRRVKEMDKQPIAQLLAECFEVDQRKVLENLLQLFDKYDLTLTTSFEGLARLWQSLAQDLKERDPVNIEATAFLLNYFYVKAKATAQPFLDEVVLTTRNQLPPALADGML